jgi:predicted HTH domain antitoxin
MPLLISDDELIVAGVTAEEARLELACRLYASGKLSLAQAARWAAMSRVDFEDALISRRIPVYRMTQKAWEEETATWQAPTPGH